MLTSKQYLKNVSCRPSWEAAEECAATKQRHKSESGIQEPKNRASLVAQWLRIRLPMQGTRVRALVREDPTCRRATKLVRHNY